MLDEILENQQYKAEYLQFFDDPCHQNGCSKCDYSICPFRLSYLMLSNKRSGIRRALESIARGELYTGKDLPNIEKAERKTKEWLKKHLSFEYISLIWPSEEPLDPDAKKPDTFFAMKKGLLNFKSRFHKPIFPKNDRIDNDINALTCETIIASALAKGPLKTYYLKAEKDPGKMYVEKKKKNVKKTTLTEIEMDYLLKLTAAFLLEQEYRRQNSLDPENYIEQECLELTEADVLNWGISHTTKHPTFYFADTKEDIFTREYVSKGQNNVKFRFNKTWLDNFTLIDVTNTKDRKAFEKKAAKEHWLYYIDQGSGRKLLKKEL